MKRRLEVTIDRTVITRAVVLLIGGILLLHFYWWTTDALDLPGETLWRRLSNVDVESTFPTWVSAVLHLGVAILLWITYRATDEYRRHWGFLALIFLAFSIDEVAAIHELFARPLRSALNLDGFFYYAWVVPALFAVVVVGIVYARFVLDLPSPIRGRIILAAALFVGGALGLEMVTGAFVGTASRDGWPYFLVSTLEETMEMAAAVIMIDTLLLHLHPLQVVFMTKPGRKTSRDRA